MIQLDAELILGFQQEFLHAKFDNPTPPAAFHIECWERSTSNSKQVATSAPRGHAKSTSQTHTLGLAFMLFRVRDFCMIVSDTESQAVAFLRDISAEIQENERLRAAFGVKGFIKDAEAEMEVEFLDGTQFKMVAKGGDQKVRGTKWRNKRPNLILIDDLENDESVMNPERRKKLKDWFFKALIPCGAKNCLIRAVGTILHFDSLLENIMDDPEWVSKRYAAHKSWDDFTEILWPEQFDETRLRTIRQQFINTRMPDGYTQEYLSTPLSNENSYFKREWFSDFTYSDYDAPKEYYVGVDFAISKKQTADRTVIAVVGVNRYGVTFVEHVRKGRWDSKEIVDNLFEVSEQFDVQVWYMEKGAIQKSIGPFLSDEMVKRNNYLNVVEMLPATDKEMRAKPIQGRMRNGGLRFDKSADWYDDFEMEMLRFPRGAHDDQVDALSLIGQNLHNLISASTPQEEEAEEWAMMDRENAMGRNATTGY